jgi:hypothetical protein
MLEQICASVEMVAARSFETAILTKNRARNQSLEYHHFRGAPRGGGVLQICSHFKSKSKNADLKVTRITNILREFEPKFATEIG